MCPGGRMAEGADRHAAARRLTAGAMNWCHQWGLLHTLKATRRQEGWGGSRLNSHQTTVTASERSTWAKQSG